MSLLQKEDSKNTQDKFYQLLQNKVGPNPDRLLAKKNETWESYEEAYKRHIGAYYDRRSIACSVMRGERAWTADPATLASLPGSDSPYYFDFEVTSEEFALYFPDYITLTNFIKKYPPRTTPIIAPIMERILENKADFSRIFPNDKVLFNFFANRNWSAYHKSVLTYLKNNFSQFLRFFKNEQAAQEFTSKLWDTHTYINVAEAYKESEGIEKNSRYNHKGLAEIARIHLFRNHFVEWVGPSNPKSPTPVYEILPPSASEIARTQSLPPHAGPEPAYDSPSPSEVARTQSLRRQAGHSYPSSSSAMFGGNNGGNNKPLSDSTPPSTAPAPAASAKK